MKTLYNFIRESALQAPEKPRYNEKEFLEKLKEYEENLSNNRKCGFGEGKRVPYIEIKLGRVSYDYYNESNIDTWLMIGYDNVDDRNPVIAMIQNIEENRYGNHIAEERTFKITSYDDLVSKLKQMKMIS